MDLTEFKASLQSGPQPPGGLSQEAQALWHAKKGNWDAAHNIAQDIHTPLGSWIHALLHLIEGDTGNAHYWLHKAGKSPVKTSQIDALWEEIAEFVLRQR